MSAQGAKSHGPSDEAILRSVRAGNRQAFEQLVQRWQGELMRFLRLLGADEHEAEDVVQETFLKLYARCRRAEIPTQGTVRPLLFRIARNVRIDTLRKKRRSPRTLPLDEAAEVTAGGSADASQRGEALDVLEALKGLPEKHRVALVLNVFHGLSYREIAASLEIPVGTVKSRVHYALNSLKERLHVRRAH